MFRTINTFGFSATQRLLRSDGFEHVIHAKKVKSNFYKIFFVCNGKNNARLGIVASKRIIPGSVQRNRVKRLIREAFRQHSIKYKPFDLVVMVKVVDSQAKQSNDLNTLFSQIEEICVSL